MGAAAGIGSILGGAASLLGATKKQKETPSYAAAPTQTPQQAELTNFLMPTMKDWMTNPPKVTRPAWNPTQVKTGAAKSGFTPGQQTTNPEYAKQQSQIQGWQNQINQLNQQRPASSGPAQTFGEYGPQADGSFKVQPMASEGSMINKFGPAAQAQYEYDKANGKLPAASGQSANYDTQIAALQKQIADAQGGMPQEMIQGAGQLNIADAPTLAPTMGTLGQFEQKDYSGLINQAAKPYTDQTGQINQFMSGPTTPQALDYQNSLDPMVQQRMTGNLDRKIQEGYDADYLKSLAAAGIDPLKEAYDQALKSATADYNRRGMGASGFEFGQKFGSQPDSITKNYLQNVGNVQRDVALRGAEAARADRFTNANMQDQALGNLANLAQTQQGNQLQRLGVDTSRQLQEKNLQQQGLGMLNQQEQQQRQLAQQQLGNTMQADQSNEANRQWWANMTGDQQRYDQQNQIADWQRNTDLAMNLAGREDQNSMTQIDRGAEDQKTNIGYQQQALQNIMNFINGQQATANNAQQNYWNAAQMQQSANNQQQAQQMAGLQGLGSMFAKQNPVAPVQQAAITPAQFQGYNAAAQNAFSGIQNTLQPATGFLNSFYNAFS